MSVVTPDKVAAAGGVKAFVTAIVTNAAILLVEVGAFMYLRRHVKKIYAPRTYLPPPSRRSQPIGKGYFEWIPAIIKTPATEIIHKNGLDAYFFLRFLRLLLKLFTAATFITFAVLVPVNIVHPNQLTTGISRIAWGNIPDDESARYSAHVAVAYVLTFYTFYLLREELTLLVSLRQRYLTSKTHSKLAQARTVLITGIPKELLSESALREFASFVPGGVSNIWIYRESKALTDLYEDREEACQKLETACTHLLRRATHIQAKNMTRALAKGQDVPPPNPTLALLESLVPPKKRPHHRLGLLGLFGKKVDTIEWAKAVLPDLDRRIAAARHDLQHVPPAGSAFIEFNLQLGAHVMDQCLSYHEPLKMVDKWVEVAAEDVVWSNIDDGSYETRLRFILSWAATIGLIVGFAPIAAFVTSISNLSALCEHTPWLAWVCKAPAIATGLLQGVLPPLLMAILFMLVPHILRLLAWFECVPRVTLISQRVYTRYFIFLVVHGFITGTLASGLIAAIPQALDNPKTIVQQLANNLPKASIYFLTYIIATGFSYLFLYIMDQPEHTETGGLYFPRAVSNLFVGLYVQQITVATLLFLRVPIEGARIASIIQGAFMLFLIVLTFLAQALLHNSFDAIVEHMPMSLATKHMKERYEHERKKSGLESLLPDDMDLFNREHIRAVVKHKLKGTSSRLGLPSLPSTNLHIPKVLKPSSPTSSSKHVLTTSSQGSSTSVNRHPHSPQHEMVQNGPNITVTSPPPPPPPPPPFASRLSTAGSVVRDSEEDDADIELDEHAFDHPASYKPAKWAWVPRDPFGLSEVIVQDLVAAGIQASDVGATVDKKGVVKVSRNPPDEQWEGGMDA
ncbi:hypothetical protein EXIGLDRAFT_831757 [Exidia glandulosa HHB12029]|uniref:DUF221-domain-containing protein n=1 Tax=Exidia glandulosa HHB12029 TaxID=1314781 RepID=A0A165MA22_EXIGL|nr:hypothetical protein EXIGLDRAFT_831757 [Exidia glandulosa HHB12029]